MAYEITNAVWTRWQLIAFRFFFIFLLLQVVTENFFGNLFGGTRVVWQLGETIFVPACLWLNDHLFHFRYNPPRWTIFSPGLHTIRDIMYLSVASIGTVTWSLIDRGRLNYNVLLYWFSWGLIIVLSCIEFAYGIVKFFPVQMPYPSMISVQRSIGEMTPFELLWTTIGYGQPYQVFSGVVEVVGALLILFRRTRVLGLLIIVAVMVNVVMLNYTYQIGVLELSSKVLLVAMFLLAPYSRQLLGFFIGGWHSALNDGAFEPRNRSREIIVKGLTLLFLITSYFLTANFSYSAYSRLNKVRASAEYSLVKEHIADGDTLGYVRTDTVRWTIWYERIANEKRIVTIMGTKPSDAKVFDLQKDSVKGLFVLRPFNANDTTAVRYKYSDLTNGHWSLESMSDKKTRIEFQRVKPDSVTALFKVKREIVVTDDVL
jgi:hypothetical protein